MTDAQLVRSNVRVAAINTDAADLAVLASVVAAHAYELRVLEPGPDLVEELVADRPDAVVLDVKQRAGTGYELCSALKADPLTAGVAVILTGSLAGPEARQRAFAAGCDEFFEKPIHRQLLAHRLRSFARLRRAWLHEVRSSNLSHALRAFAEPAPAGLLGLGRAFGAHIGLTVREQVALELALIARDRGDPAAGATDHADAAGRLARVYRILDVYELVAGDAGDAAEAIAILRRDAEYGDLDGALVTAFASWLAAS